MGGTSCDISVVLRGKPWVNDTFELEWDLVVNALSTDIVTLGAGGGSIVSIGNAGELRVGPQSAGAQPGPACYGQGGQSPTLTDAALAIGILAPDRFVGGRVPLHRALALEAFEGLDCTLSTSERIRQAWLIGLHNVAEGILDIAVRRGIDVRDFSLVAFGAAGPMLLPGLLDLLPSASVIVPPNPGGFSALGLVSSDRVFSDSRTHYGVLDPDRRRSDRRVFAQLESDAARAGRSRGRPGDRDPHLRRPAARAGMGDALRPGARRARHRRVQVGQMIASFHSEYEQRNGHRFESLPRRGCDVPGAARGADGQGPLRGARAARPAYQRVRRTMVARAPLRGTGHGSAAIERDGLRGR